MTMSSPDDWPLTVEDLRGLRNPLRLLAERTVAFLGDDWQAHARGPFEAVVRSPQGVDLAFTLDLDGMDEAREFVIGLIGDGNLRYRELLTLHLFTLPSHVAAMITAAMPVALEMREVARKRREYAQQRAAERGAHIAGMAQALDWNATGSKCHSHEPAANVPRARTRRTRGRYTAPLTGVIGYRDNSNTMYLRLDDLSPELANVVVNTLHYYLHRKGAEGGAA